MSTPTSLRMEGVIYVISTQAVQERNIVAFVTNVWTTLTITASGLITASVEETM